MAKMSYVEPDGYFSPSMLKALKAGEKKAPAKKATTSKPTAKKSTKK